jgi:hypothetical protein
MVEQSLGSYKLLADKELPSQQLVQAEVRDNGTELTQQAAVAQAVEEGRSVLSGL